MLEYSKLAEVRVMTAKRSWVRQLPTVTLSASELGAARIVGWFKPVLIDRSSEGYALLLVLDGVAPALMISYHAERDGAAIVVFGHRVPHMVLT